MTDIHDWLSENDELPTPEAVVPTARTPLPGEVEQLTKQFEEPCAKCRGTGRWGFQRRTCFGCKGSGKKFFKTAPEVRAKAREGQQRREAAKMMAWIEAYPQQWQWIITKAPTFDFARAMMDAVTKYHSLSDKQLAAVERCMVKDAERKAQREAEAKARIESAPEVSIAAIETAFATAMGNQIKRPKLRLDTFIFSPAPATGKNAGAIYVTQGDYLGKIVDGKFHRTRECTDDQEQRIVAAAANPAAAAKAYGLRVGACSVCGRELTKGQSIDAGIGPICSQKYGWG